jgi:hypothetical protein
LVGDAPGAFDQRDQAGCFPRFGQQAIQDRQVRCRFGLRQDQVIGTGAALQERLKIGQAETPVQSVNAQRPRARARRRLRQMGECCSSRLGLVGGSRRVIEIDDGDVRPEAAASSKRSGRVAGVNSQLLTRVSLL